MRALKWIVRGAIALLLGVTFVVSLALGTLLHLSSKPARRLIETHTGPLLEGVVAGSFAIDDVGALGLSGVFGIDARLLHPDGGEVLRLSDIEVSLDVASVVWSALAGDGPLVVQLDKVRVGAADVSVAEGESGSLRLLEALATEPSSGPPGRPVTLRLPSIALAHAWFHGAIESAGLVVDADLDHLDASLSLEADALSLSLRGAEITTRAMPHGADVEGSLHGALAIPASGSPLSASAAFDGLVAAAEVRAEGKIEGDEVHAELAIPTISPALVRRFVPDAPLTESVSLAAVASGTLPKLHASVTLAARATTIEIEADVITAPATSAAIVVRGRRLDASLVGGPATEVDLDATAAVDLAAAPRGTFHLATSPGVVADTRIPAATFDGSFEGDSLEAHGRVDEPRLPLDVRFALAGPRATFAVDLENGDLRALEERGVAMSGLVTVHASGKADLDASTASASASVAARGLAAFGVRVGAANVALAVSGPLEDPALSARVDVRGVDAGLPSPVDAHAVVSGRVLSPIITADIASEGLPDAHVSTSLDLRGGLRVGPTRVALTQGDVTAEVRVLAIDLRGDRPAIVGAEVTGLGAPLTFSFTPTPGGSHIVAHAERLDLARVGVLAGSLYRVKAGEADLDVDLTLTRKEANGRIEVHVAGARVGLLGDRDASADIEALFLRRRAMLSAKVALAGVGSVAVTSRNLAELGGSPLSPSAWTEAEGAVAIDADIDLAGLASALPPWLLPVDDLAGTLALGGVVDRPRRAEDPDLDLTVGTDGLGLTLAEPRLDLRAIDAHVHLRCARDAPGAVAEAWADDAEGTVARVEVATDSACRALTEELRDAARLAKLPLRLRVTVPQRALATFPPIVGAPSVPGDVGLTLLAEGTLEGPRASIEGRGRGIELVEEEGVPPLDVDLAGGYAEGRAEATLGVATEGRKLVAARMEGTGSVSELLLHPEAAPAWTASADVDLLDLPLDGLRAFTDINLGGTAGGRVTLRGLHDDARLDAELHVDDLRIDGFSQGKATLTARMQDGSASAHLTLAPPGGHLRANAELGLRWGARLVPEFELLGPIALDIDAAKLRLRPLQPFLASSFDRIDGFLDGHLGLTSDAGERVAEGELTLRDGAFQPTGSNLFEDVRATVAIAESGEVALRGAYARSGGGELRADGKARLDAEGLRDGSAVVTIAEDKAIPVVLEGQELASVSGRIESRFERTSPHDLRVDVTVPKLRVALPEQLPGSVQSLDPPENVRIGTLKRGHFVPAPRPDDGEPEPEAKAAPEGALTLRVSLPDVEVKQAAGVTVRLHGAPHVVVQGGATVTGQIVLDGGTVDIKGRLFTLQSGTITFTGKADNPDVVLTASWVAPDDTTIYADFVGPLQTGKVTLRSDPALPNSEILALLLFGRAQGTVGDGGGADTQTTALGAAGEVAARGLNRFLSDVTDIEVKTRIDTSSSATPRTEVEVQIARDLALQLATVLGEPLPGQTPDRNYVTLTWALSRAWALETTVGDQGSTLLDLVWERVY